MLNDISHAMLIIIIIIMTIKEKSLHGMDLGINKKKSCACKVHFPKIQKIIAYYTWRSPSLPRANVIYLSRKQGG